MKQSTKQVLNELFEKRSLAFRLEREAAKLESTALEVEKAHTRLKLTDKSGEVTYSPYGQELTMQFQLFLEQEGYKIEFDRNEAVIKLAVFKLSAEAWDKRFNAKAAKAAFDKGLKNLPPLSGAQLWKASERLLERGFDDPEQSDLFKELYKYS